MLLEVGFEFGIALSPNKTKEAKKLMRKKIEFFIIIHLFNYWTKFKCWGFNYEEKKKFL